MWVFFFEKPKKQKQQTVEGWFMMIDSYLDQMYQRRHGILMKNDTKGPRVEFVSVRDGYV